MIVNKKVGTIQKNPESEKYEIRLSNIHEQ